MQKNSTIEKGFYVLFCFSFSNIKLKAFFFQTNLVGNETEMERGSENQMSFG